MPTVKLTRITIVAEAVLESLLVQDLARLGAKGYTLTRVEGRGTRGLRVGDLGANIKLESVVSDDVAERLLLHLSERYFKNYAMIAYLDKVEVMRGDKYV